MSAALLWARAELRARWRSWGVLGLPSGPAATAAAAIDLTVARRYGLRIGSTIAVSQAIPNTPNPFPPGVVPPGVRSFRARLHVVGIFKSVSSDASWSPSSGLWTAHR